MNQIRVLWVDVPKTFEHFRNYLKDDNFSVLRFDFFIDCKTVCTFASSSKREQSCEDPIQESNQLTFTNIELKCQERRE